jgi:hypothetical protein
MTETVYRKQIRPVLIEGADATVPRPSIDGEADTADVRLAVSPLATG